MDIDERYNSMAIGKARSIAKKVAQRDSRFDEDDVFETIKGYYRMGDLTFDEQSDMVAEILKDDPEKYEGVATYNEEVHWNFFN